MPTVGTRAEDSEEHQTREGNIPLDNYWKTALMKMKSRTQ